MSEPLVAAAASSPEQIEAQAEAFRDCFAHLRAQIGTVFVGQRSLVDQLLLCFFCQGHVLIEGSPGLGKTLLVRTLSDALNLRFARIQCTPDLMPADVTGTNLLTEGPSGERQFAFQRGPIFANIVLADELNRATPRTQSAFLEAMQERHVTVFGVTHCVEEPFSVFATQNPIEMEGTYPLPEAQLDRFFFKLRVAMPSVEDLAEILARTTTHPDVADSPDFVKKYVKYGASPRAAQAMILAAKALALLAGRYHVAVEDVRPVVVPALNHRIIRNFHGEMEQITTESIIDRVVNAADGG
jgi:MoxR-like ATPase